MTLEHRQAAYIRNKRGHLTLPLIAAESALYRAMSEQVAPSINCYGEQLLNTVVNKEQLLSTVVNKEQLLSTVVNK
jgi:hypothetical protein